VQRAASQLPIGLFCRVAVISILRFRPLKIYSCSHHSTPTSMDFNTSFSPPILFSGFSSPGFEDNPDESELHNSSSRFRGFDSLYRHTDAQLEIPHITHHVDSHPDVLVTDNGMNSPDWTSNRPRLEYRATSANVGLAEADYSSATQENPDQLRNDHQSTNQQSSPNHRHSQATSQPEDLADRVKGMYRLLALIGESGSNGYVDKVVIAQDSLQRFVNAMSPGAYASVTKVDFKTLDRLMIKPLGVYGSKDVIVRLLTSIGAIDEEGAHLFLAPTGSLGTHPTLSSGLYIVRETKTDLVDERHYVIYWPEESTWDDSATSSACRNRVTFMRYLTKMCDQVVALLSPEQSASLVWNEQQSDAESVDTDVDDYDRLFAFEVSKTNEQEESAAARLGFQMGFPFISHHRTPDCPVDPAILSPRLLLGETSQGILTTSYIPRRIRSKVFDRESFSETSLKQLLMDNAFVLSETLDEDKVKALNRIAISALFPGLCDEWLALKQDIYDIFRRESTNRKGVVFREIVTKEGPLRRILREAVIEEVVSLFPSIDRSILSSLASSHKQLDTGEVATNGKFKRHLRSHGSHSH
jgi:hypothetical protein